MKLCKLLLAVVGATVLLGALVGTASANRLSSSSLSFTAHWTSAEFSGGFGTPRCSLTLEGTIHSATIAKTLGALIGYITRASVGPCVNGSATVLTATLPWHTQYAGFGGSLPTPSSIITNTIGAQWQIRETGGITCLARTEARHIATGTYALNASGEVTGVTLGGSTPTSCGFEGTLRGTSSSNTAQRITLI